MSKESWQFVDDLGDQLLARGWLVAKSPGRLIGKDRGGKLWLVEMEIDKRRGKVILINPTSVIQVSMRISRMLDVLNGPNNLAKLHGVLRYHPDGVDEVLAIIAKESPCLHR